MNNFMKPMDEFNKEIEKEQKISELEKAIKKAEAEEKTSDVEKLKKALKDLTHESFLEKFFNIMY